MPKCSIRVVRQPLQAPLMQPGMVLSASTIAWSANEQAWQYKRIEAKEDHLSSLGQLLKRQGELWRHDFVRKCNNSNYYRPTGRKHHQSAVKRATIHFLKMMIVRKPFLSVKTVNMILPGPNLNGKYTGGNHSHRAEDFAARTDVGLVVRASST